MNTFGHKFRVTTFGESHGVAVGAVIDGYPANVALCESDIQTQLDRRRPGQSDITTPRGEADVVKILSGVDSGRTLGTPIAMIVENRDVRANDYLSSANAVSAMSAAAAIPRPSHADYSYMMKYGVTAQSGGGRASARETVARVAAGAAAEIFLRDKFGIDIIAFTSAAGGIRLDNETDIFTTVTRDDVDKNAIRCPDEIAAEKMIALVKRVKEEDDSVGGIVTCVCRNVPAGFGDPVFGKLDAALAQAMMSIPAAKGFEIGSGFACAAMRGSEHNDLFIKKPFGDGIGTVTNRSGGILGGISNGEPIYFRVAFKPTPTIGKEQHTVDYGGNDVILKSTGRHDPCVLPRAVPVVEAMAALALMDAAM